MNLIYAHYNNYKQRSSLDFLWRITLETVVLMLLLGQMFAFIIGQPNGGTMVIDELYLFIALVVAPLTETLIFQALIIAIGRYFKVRLPILIVISTLVFASVHLPVDMNTLSAAGIGGVLADFKAIFADGIHHVIAAFSGFVVAGLLGGFYLAFTYALFCQRSHWTAIWVTTASHAIGNAFFTSLTYMGFI